METHEKRTPVKDLFLRTVAVLGLIAILLLGAWGIIQLAFAIPSVLGDIGANFTSLFTHNTTTTSNSTKEAVVVTVPGTIASGSTLAVSWMHQNADKSGQYSYAISYACQSNVTIKAPLPTGNYQAVPCNTLFNYVNASEHMSLVPTLAGNASEPLTITVVTTKLSTGLVTATGSATVTLTPTGTKPSTSSGQTTSKPASAHVSTSPSTTYYPAATRSTNLYGYGDLAVHFTSTAPSNSATVVKFVIENTGTNVVPAGWTFNATLPINGSYVFGSQPQQALYPGDKIAYTLSFAGANAASQYPTYNYGTTYPYGYVNNAGYPAQGYTCNGYNCVNSAGYPNYNTNYGYGYGYGYQTATITISADPQNVVPEYNKGNNTAQTTIPLY